MILFQVSEHAVRPVDHAGFHEGEGASAQGEFFPFLYGMIIPGIGKMTGQVFGAHLGAVKRFVLVQIDRQTIRIRLAFESARSDHSFSQRNLISVISPHQ